MSEAAETKAGPGTLARLAIDLGPLVVFFAAYSWKGIIPGTIAFMVAITAAILISLIRYRHISPLLWFSGVMVLVMGSLTVWLHNETFIKMKPTIYYGIVAAILLFGLAMRRNVLKLALGAAYPGLSERGWQLLSRNFAIFFIVLAIVNEIVWRNFSTGFWVGFKLWGAIPATFLFGLANMPMLIRHGLALEAVKEEAPIPPPE